MLIIIIQSGPEMLLVACRNILGPFDNINLINWILCIRLFANISNTMITIEVLIIWYVNEKVLKAPIKMDEMGMTECLKFFTIVYAIGFTFLLQSIDKDHHNLLIRFSGLPIDFNKSYLVDTR